MRPSKVAAHHFRRDRHIHRAEQGEPAIRGIAKRGDLALRVDHGSFRAGINRSTGAKAGRDDTWARVASANGAHHVVSPTGTHQHLGVEAQGSRGRGLQIAHRLVAPNQRRQFVAQLGVNRPKDGVRPLAGSDIEQRRTAGVAIFHYLSPGEPEIQVIVRQENTLKPLVVFRLVFSEPENL